MLRYTTHKPGECPFWPGQNLKITWNFLPKKDGNPVISIISNISQCVILAEYKGRVVFWTEGQWHATE